MENIDSCSPNRPLPPELARLDSEMDKYLLRLKIQNVGLTVGRGILKAFESNARSLNSVPDMTLPYSRGDDK